MAHDLNGISIPSGLVWADEFEWADAESASEYGITGALLIDAAERLSGRPITLEGQDDAGWLERSALLSVPALADVPGATYAFTHHDGRVFTVAFAPGGNPISARPVARPELPPSDWPYVAIIRLIEVQ